MGFNISSFISFSRITLGEALTRPLSSLLQSQVLHLKLNLSKIVYQLCCRDKPTLTPCCNCFFNLLFVAFVIIIIHNGLPPRLRAPLPDH